MSNNFDIVKGLLQENGEVVSCTSGKSMLPLFRDGRDRAVIVPLLREPRVNDVLLYRKASTNEVVLHRVIKTRGGTVLRGDNLYFCEQNIPAQDILGVMKGFYRNDKYCDCEKSTTYKLYCFYIRASYPLRRLAKKACSFVKKAFQKKINAA